MFHMLGTVNNFSDYDSHREVKRKDCYVYIPQPELWFGKQGRDLKKLFTADFA